MTDRDRVVAEIIPARDIAEGTPRERGWAELIRLGLVTPAKVPHTAPMPPRQMAVVSLEELMADLDASRSDD